MSIKFSTVQWTASMTSCQQAFPQQCRKLENEQLGILCQNTNSHCWREKAQLWLFIGVAFEVFICLLIKNFSKLYSCLRLKAIKETADTVKGVWPDGRCHLGKEALVTEWTSGAGEESSGSERKKTHVDLTVLAMPLLRQESINYVPQLHWSVGGKPNLLKEEQVDWKMKHHGWWDLFWSVSWVCSLQMSLIYGNIALFRLQFSPSYAYFCLPFMDVT